MTTFKDIIDQCYINEFIANDNRNYNDKIHLSELDCIRKHALKILGYKPPMPSPEDMRVFDFGTMIHERWQGLLVKYGYIDKEAVERSVTSDIYPLDSHADVAPIVIDDLPWILDFKTCKDAPSKSYTCKSCKTKGKTIPSQFDFSGLKKPLDKHVEQLSLYMYFLQIPRGKLIYINKNSGQWTTKGRLPDIKEFDVFLDELQVRIYLQEVKKLTEFIRTRILPDKPDGVTDFQCNYFCGLQDICTSLS